MTFTFKKYSGCSNSMLVKSEIKEKNKEILNFMFEINK